MWESRVLCEISKSLGNRFWVSIGTAFPQPSSPSPPRARDRNSGDAVPLPACRSSFLAPPTRSFLSQRGSESLTSTLTADPDDPPPKPLTRPSPPHRWRPASDTRGFDGDAH